MKERAGGPVVKEWDNHFLRDDTEIRKGYCEPGDEEAYSLFRIEPYGRDRILVGDKEWAISKAEEIIQGST